MDTASIVITTKNAGCSLEETRYHLLLAKDLGYLGLDRYKGIEEKCREISLMLNSLIKYNGPHNSDTMLRYW